MTLDQQKSHGSWRPYTEVNLEFQFWVMWVPQSVKFMKLPLTYWIASRRVPANQTVDYRPVASAIINSTIRGRDGKTKENLEPTPHSRSNMAWTSILTIINLLNMIASPKLRYLPLSLELVWNSPKTLFHLSLSMSILHFYLKTQLIIQVNGISISWCYTFFSCFLIGVVQIINQLQQMHVGPY